MLPTEPNGDPQRISAEEDLIVVFRVQQKWLLVCETSLRLVTSDTELSRIEFGEVVQGVSWRGDQLAVRQEDGIMVMIEIEGDRLTANSENSDTV